MSSERLKVLVIDDEKAIRAVLRERLKSWGMTPRLAGDAAEGIELLEAFDPDLVITDVMLPDAEGTELLEAITARRPDLPVILITAHGSVDLAVEAMKAGAHDFLTKPLDHEKLRALVDEAGHERRRRRSAARVSAALDDEGRFGELIGASPAMREVAGLIREAAPTGAPVLLTGASGTGKELAARTLHGESGRADGPFVAVNAAAIPRDLIESELFGHEKGAFTGATDSRKGCFELAHEGTLLLDEVAEMPLELQPKLLRVLEDGRVRRVGGSRELAFDVRLVAATNRDPRRAIEEGALREDLFYRLAVFQIELPALRERGDDLELLAQHFVELYNDRHGASVSGLSSEALERLQAYDWPGNVRELSNVLQRAVVVGRSGWIEPGHLPPYLRQDDRLPTIALAVGTTVAEAERRLILETLKATGENKAEAARRLGVDVKTVRNKLKGYAKGEEE